MSKDVMDAEHRVTRSAATDGATTVSKVLTRDVDGASDKAFRSTLTARLLVAATALFVADWVAKALATTLAVDSSWHRPSRLIDTICKVGGMAVLTVWYALGSRTTGRDQARPADRRTRMVVTIALALSTVGDLLTQLPIGFYFGVLVFTVVHLTLIAVVDFAEPPLNPHRRIIWLCVIVEVVAIVGFFGGSPLGCDTPSNALLIVGYVGATIAAIVVFWQAAKAEPRGRHLRGALVALVLLALADLTLMIRSSVGASTTGCVPPESRGAPALAVVAIVLYQIGQLLLARSLAHRSGAPDQIPAQDTKSAE